MSDRDLMSVFDDVEPSQDAREEAKALKRDGRHVDAAEVLFRAGFLDDAGDLFAAVMEFGRALQCYEQAGSVEKAMEIALRADIPGAVDRIVSEAVRTEKADGLLRLVRAASRDDAAAKVLIAIGDLDGAADAFEAAGDLRRAGDAKEAFGDLRGAGVLYERALVDTPNDPEICLRLGRILARFSRHDDAVKLLQTAIRTVPDDTLIRDRAAPVLILAFLELGYSAAADFVFSEWKRKGGDAKPEAAQALAGFLASPRAAALSSTMVGAMRAKESRKQVTRDPFFGDADDDVSSSDDIDNDAVHDEGTALLAGRYLLGEPLGGGGVGQVFRAHDALLDQVVAVKIFGGQALSSEALSFFAREARAASSLGHAAIIRLVELNMSLGFVVTEFSSAPTVEERLREGGPSSWLLPFMRTTLDTLATVHRIGLVHGGLKPTNVFIAPAGLRISDFGAHHLLALRSTETGGLASAWPYLAPEQLFGEEPSVSADLYALAAMVYRALTGVPPFSTVEDDRRKPPRAISAHDHTLAPWDAFMARALHPHKADRFHSAVEMKGELPDVLLSPMLPASTTTEDKTIANTIDSRDQGRYALGPLVFRDTDRAKVFEASDLLVERPVWIIEALTDEALKGLAAAASIPHGAQPIYDVIHDRRQVVVARDARSMTASLDDTRAFPQGLFRDLSSVSSAVESMHVAGFSLGGFPVERAMGPVGPRLRIAPAPVPVPLTPEGRELDELSVAAFIRAVIGGGDDHARLYTPDELLIDLEAMRLFSRDDTSHVLSTADVSRWSSVCQAVAERLVLSAEKRVIARLAVNVVKGEG